MPEVDWLHEIVLMLICCPIQFSKLGKLRCDVKCQLMDLMFVLACDSKINGNKGQLTLHVEQIN